jgi:serine/threonine-protein kinase
VNPGDVISRYRILGILGKGGMGVVYRAQDLRLEREVALKFLPRDAFNERSTQRFLNEARAPAKLRHPNICPIYDFEEADGEHFLVMAYIEGETIQRKLMRGRFPARQAAELGAQIASGLACAHALGVIHRDIKCGNLMMDAAGQAHILDFGLALAPEALRLTHSGASVGTPAYMSPEQIEGRHVDSRADLWSLGVVLFEMLTGELPFRRQQSAAVIHAVLHDPLPPIAKLRPELGAEWEQFMEKALAKDASRRFQTAEEMGEELKRLAAVGSDSETRMTQTMAMPRLRRRPIARWRWIAAAGVVLALGAGAWFVLKPRNSSPIAQATTGSVAQLAILPFQVQGGEQLAGTVADGLVEVLGPALADAGRAKGTLVAFTAAELRNRRVASVEEARQVFGATIALAGEAKQAGDKVDFTVKLVDARSSAALAERTFSYDPKDPLVSRDQAVQQIGAMLKLDLAPAARSSSAAPETSAPSAYSAYLEGRGYLARHDLPGNVDRAIASFTAATEQDRRYALAFSGLGEAYWRKAHNTGDGNAAALANQNAERAVTLDPNLAIAHTVLGYVYVDAGKQADAIRELQKAMDLAPNNAEAPRKLAEIYKAQGKFDQAEALYLRSVKSRPTDWYGYLLLGVFYYERERYEDAEATLNQAKALTPDNELVRVDLAAFYRQHGRYEDAIAEYQQALRIRSTALTYLGLAGAYYYQHKFTDAVRAAEAALDLDTNDYRIWGNYGIYCRWAQGSETKSEPALKRAVELATQYARANQSEYSVYANLAEYRARLKDAKGAMAEIDRIPEALRGGQFSTRLAIAYELTGRHDKAVAVIRSNMKSPASLNQIKADPDLSAVWRDIQPR